MYTIIMNAEWKQVVVWGSKAGIMLLAYKKIRPTCNFLQEVLLKWFALF